MSSNPTWDAHWATLTEHERHLFETDEHPSLSWDFAPRAAEYVTELRQQLAALDYVERVSLDFYHGDTLVLTVHLSRCS